MIFFVGFLLVADTTWAEGKFTGRLAIKVPSLGALNLCWTNPAMACGLGGSILNPASLSDIKEKTLSTAVGLPSETGFTLRPPFDLGPELGVVEVPFGLSFTQPVSMNLMAFGINLKELILGLGFIEEFGLGIKASGITSFPYRFNDTIRDTLTNADIPDIPEGDTIPVALCFMTPVKFSLIGDGIGNWSDNRFFLGIARPSESWFKAGVGITYTPLRGRISYGIFANADAPCTLECWVTDSGWTIDGIGVTQINEDVVEASSEIKFIGDRFNLLSGLLIDFKFIKFGATLEFMPKTTLKVEGSSGVTYINNIPDIDTFYADSIVVDTVDSIISGTIGVELSEFPNTTETDRWESKYELGGKIAITLGSAIELGPFTAGLAVGASSIGDLYLSAGFESRLLFPLRTTFELCNKAYQINEETLMIPYIMLGIGSSLRVRNLSMDFGVRTNSFHTLASLVETVEKEELPGLFELFSPVIGINLKFE